MFRPKLVFVLVLCSPFASAQERKAAPPSEITTPVAFPIVFTKTVSADHSRPGDIVLAKTSQRVRLDNGAVIPAGAKVTGHIVAANRFVYDETPYARQKPSTLTLQFDSVAVNGASLPLHVTVRAMADPITSWDAREPGPSDLDPQGTVTQIGGDQLTRWQSKVVNMDGDVVAYNKPGGVYAHLIANGHCDAGDIEVSVDIFSASACGLYGFTNVFATEFGSVSHPSTLTLVSLRTSPKIWKHSTALLEVLSQPIASTR